jgi:hypothetical protein
LRNLTVGDLKLALRDLLGERSIPRAGSGGQPARAELARVHPEHVIHAPCAG